MFKEKIIPLQSEFEPLMETQNIEYKESWRDEYLKWICGFANAQGGTLYIGKNDKGEVVGVADAKRLLEDIPNKVSNTLGLVLGICLPRRSGKAIHCNQCAVKPDPYFIQRGLLSPFWRNCPRVERHCSAGIFYGQGRDGMG